MTTEPKYNFLSRDGTKVSHEPMEVEISNVNRITYANTYSVVGLSNEDGTGFYEACVFTTEQMTDGDVQSRMRYFGDYGIEERDLVRLELQAILEGIKFLPRLCATNIYVSDKKVEKLITGFAAADKNNHPHADLLYPIHALGMSEVVNVCPTPLTPILDGMDHENEILKQLTKLFNRWLKADLKANAKLGQYMPVPRPDYGYVYDLVVPVEWTITDTP